MSRIARPIPTAPRRLTWKLALPALGLAACAAFFAHAGAARAATPASGQGTHFMIGHGDRGNAYALVRDTPHGTSLSGDGAEWKDIDAAKRSIKGKFLWFRQGGKAYVVQDPAVLARAEAAWAPVDRLGEQMDSYGKQMDEHGKKMEAMGKEMAHASLRSQPNGSMEEMGARMRDAAKPMDELGKQMGALGKQMEQRSHEADKSMRELIRDAMSKGLARPAPANG